jgi:hypothetical protein
MAGNNMKQGELFDIFLIWFLLDRLFGVFSWWSFGTGDYRISIGKTEIFDDFCYGLIKLEFPNFVEIKLTLFAFENPH